MEQQDTNKKIIELFFKNKMHYQDTRERLNSLLDEEYQIECLDVVLLKDGSAKITVYDKEKDMFVELKDLNKRTRENYINRILKAINTCYTEEEDSNISEENEIDIKEESKNELGEKEVTESKSGGRIRKYRFL